MLSKVEEDLEDAYSNPTLLAHELLHKAAFSGGLSNPLMPDPANLYNLTGDVLREYVSAAFKAGNIAVTAAGLSLSQLQQVIVRGRGVGGGIEACQWACGAGAATQAGPPCVDKGVFARVLWWDSKGVLAGAMCARLCVVGMLQVAAAMTACLAAIVAQQPCLLSVCCRWLGPFCQACQVVQPPQALHPATLVATWPPSPLVLSQPWQLPLRPRVACQM